MHGKGLELKRFFRANHIEKCVDDSLRSLGVDCIDVMQFHVWQDDFVNNDGWKETLKK